MPAWLTQRTQQRRGTPTGVPAWRVGAPLNEFIEISGTSGAGGSAVDAFSGLALVGTKLVIAAAGGHDNSSDNRVVSIDLSDDAPSWAPLMDTSGLAEDDVAYYSDGKPSSRHTYHMTHPIAGNKVMLGGCRFPYGTAIDLNTVDAFDLDTNTWDGVVPNSPGTSGSGYTSLTPSGYYLYAQDGDGNLWALNNVALAKFVPSTNTWTQPAGTLVSPAVRYPWAWDTSRNQFFGLCWADGEGFGTGLRAIRQIGTTQVAITFSTASAAAVAEFEADLPEYCAMEYDPDNDRFLFYEGYSDTKKIYIITPDSGTEWEMSVWNVGGSVTPTAPFGTKGLNFVGIQNRMKYVASLGGFVFLTRASAVLYFLRTV